MIYDKNKESDVGVFLDSILTRKLSTPTGLSDDQRRFYAGDPVAFAIDILGVQPWEMQKEILNQLAKHPRVTVRSAHGVGKTFTAAIATLWFLNCFVPSSVVTTATTGRQVKDVLWEEIKLRYRNSKVELGGRLLSQELRMGDKWFATGFATDEYNVEKFQGYHNVNILVIFDEASGIARTIYVGAEGLLSSGNAKILLIGNPFDESSEFGKSFKSPLYKKIHISAYDTPNLKAGKTVLPYLTSPTWVEESKEEWGENHPMWEVKVLGNFPTMSEGTLIPLAWAERARSANIRPEGVRTLGVDIARYGADESVAILREGNATIGMWVWTGNDLMESTGKIVNIIKNEHPTRINIDVIGMGGGVVDRLLELGYDATGVNVGERSNSPDKFMNIRAEMWWNLRDRFEANSIKIPDDDILSVQISSVQEEGFTSRGQLRLEDKRKTKKRQGRSPDRADALALAFYDPHYIKTLDVGSITDMYQVTETKTKLEEIFDGMRGVEKDILKKLYKQTKNSYNIGVVEEDNCISCGHTGIGIISWSNSEGNSSREEATRGKCLVCGYTWEREIGI